MTEPGDAIGPADALPAVEPRKGRALLAWVVIVALVCYMVWEHWNSQTEFVPGATARANYALLEMQARILVGTKALLGDSELLYAQAQALNSGTIGQRLRFITIAGELGGPEKALEQLRDLKKDLQAEASQPGPEDSALMNALEQLCDDYAQGHLGAPSLSAAQRQEVRSDLGWFGELALAPAGGPDESLRQAVLGEARRTAVVLISFVFGIGLLGLAGLFGLIVLLVLLFSGRIEPGVHTGSRWGGVYAETFAVWLLLFLGISYSASHWLPKTGSPLLVTALLEPLSLVAVLWPVLRGIPWQKVRAEIGWSTGRRPLLEPLIGVANYAMMLPFLAVGMVVILILLRIQQALAGPVGPGGNFSPTNIPSHPAVPYVIASDWWGRLQVFVLASVVAPIVEETMFRGVLYRHLREASRALTYPVSVAVSILFVSFIFAIIHPVPLIAVPGLMGIAFGLSLVREWRGSLIPGMVTHAIQNTLILCLVILLTSG
jgi:membrane protease YdiL (CAAX protease family)